VAIVGYPDVLPKTGNCYPTVPLSSDDVRYIDELIIRINTMIAGQAAVNDAEYVDTYAESLGHDVCKLPPERWFEGLTPTEPAYPLHPNGKGEASMARSVIRVLSGPRSVHSAPALRRNRLLVGATIGMRRARKGHPFKVRVRAVGATLRGVRVTLRDARGRRVGRSKAFALTTKRRTVRISVSRKLKPGRYRFTARGRTAAKQSVTGGHRRRLTRPAHH